MRACPEPHLLEEALLRRASASDCIERLHADGERSSDIGVCWGRSDQNDALEFAGPGDRDTIGTRKYQRIVGGKAERCPVCVERVEQLDARTQNFELRSPDGPAREHRETGEPFRYAARSKLRKQASATPVLATVNDHLVEIAARSHGRGVQ